MNQADQELAQVELSIEQANANIERLKAFERLQDNKDFKKIITDGYFKEEASRLALLRADSNMQADKDQEQMLKMIDSIGYLRQYFNMIYQFGYMAESALEQHKMTREEILSEAS